MSSNALERLLDRMREYEQGADGSGLLTGDAVRDAADVLADGLAELVPDAEAGQDNPISDLRLGGKELQAVGWFCWYRLELRGLPVNRHELTIGLFCFLLLDLSDTAVQKPPGAQDGIRMVFGEQTSLPKAVHDMTETVAREVITSPDPEVRNSPLAVEGGVLVLRLLLRLRGPGSRAYAHWMSNLGALYLMRATAGSPDAPDLASLSRAVAAYRAALDDGSTEGLEMGTHIMGLITVFQQWELATGKFHEDLHRVLPQMVQALPKEREPVLSLNFVIDIAALSLARQGFSGLATGDGAWPRYFEQLLRPAVELLDQIVPTGHPQLAMARHCLGTALLDQRDNQFSAEALKEIVELLTLAIRATPVDARHRATVLRNLAAACALHRMATDEEVHNEQIKVLEEAIGVAPDAEGFVLQELGASYLIRFIQSSGRRRERADLETAVTWLERAEANGAGDANLEGMTQHSLLLALRLLHDHDASDLRLADRIIRLARKADSHPLLQNSSAHHKILTDTLRDRHAATGDSDSLIEAVRRLRTQQSSTNEGKSFTNQANARTALDMWEATSDPSHLEAALAHQQAVVEQTERHASANEHAHALTELAALHTMLSEAQADPSALRTAIHVAERAVALADEPDELRGWLADLLVRGLLNGLDVDLDHAVTQARLAVAAEPSTQVDYLRTRDRHRGTLGIALSLRYERGGGASDLKEGCAALRKALDSVRLRLPDRMRIAGYLGHLAAIGGQWETALSALRQSMELQSHVSSTRAQFTDQQRQLRRRSAVVNAAAACALELGRPELALELLEQGRGVLLSRAAIGREPDEATVRLAAEHPELAARLQAVLQKRDAAWHQNGDDQQNSDWRHDIDTAFEAMVAEVRELPGFAGFLRPATAEQLRQAAQRGPVLVVNVGRIRSDALIVTPTNIEVVPLPGLSEEAVAEQLYGLFRALNARGAHDARLQAAAGKWFQQHLHWLWHTVVLPVLAPLGIDPVLPVAPGDTAPLQRLWLCPTGLLSFLPLHAAADRNGDGFLPDLAICSYTPTLAALLRSKGSTGITGPPLVVAVPNAPGAAPLPGVGREAAAVARLLDGAHVLEGADASRTQVLRRLGGDVGVAHFACHAGADPSGASHSALLLNDGLLSTLDIAGLRTEAAGLAYLSACGTSQGVLDLSDEAVHLAGAFQLAGFQHVIATLWPVGDDLAEEAATLFYERLREHPDAGPAEAVTHVTRALHAKYPRVPTRWAGLLHVGP
ncbi:CHAT domain-containing protein [Streptomyces sp. AD681]|uniref:CHAT domain-containing protein n=1 Tax=Streptomyces sp. AD681 TaxID=3019069 RepID=UPI0022F15E9B|nr:CHAT domain-containing protein [Streptomyces sp. AD681]MDA5147573.1 CHAT domain-containing protein [Streptomyces sp. AD681]